MRCPNCKETIEEGLLHCPYCGQEIQIVKDGDILEDDFLRNILADEEAGRDIDIEKIDEDGKNVKTDSVNKKKTKHKKNLFPVIIAIIICAGVAAGGIMFAIFRNSNMHNPEYLSAMANQAEEKKDYDSAIKYVDKLIALDNTDIDYYLWRGDLYAENGDTENARADYQKVINLDADNKDAYEFLIKSYNDAGDYDSIMALKEQAPESVSELFDNYIVEAPVFSPDGGSYGVFFDTGITAQDGTTIYYTTDGSDPTVNSKVYDEPVSIDKEGSTVLKAIAVNGQGDSSEVAEADYEVELLPPEQPGVSPDGGQFEYEVTIEVTVPAGCTCYYTWDGSTPTENSSKYKDGIYMPEGNNILSLICVNEYGLKSDVLRCNYIYYPE